MPKLLSIEVKDKIINLREKGYSLREIKIITGKSGSTISRYIKNVKILKSFQQKLEDKRNWSKKRSENAWKKSRIEADKIIGKLNKRDKIIILLSLYWGEGTKRELNLINGDPYLIKTFVSCLKEIDVSDDDLLVTLRIFEDVDIKKTVNFWSRITGLDKRRITNVNVLSGKKNGKLPYGMCRIRVRRGGVYFKLLMSMIEAVKGQFIKPL